MKIGETFRYARPYDASPLKIDELPNFFHATQTPGSRKALLEKGINPLRSVRTTSGPRTPAILISSSPHKVGSAQTPWQDVFDPDNGHIRYFGDAKTPGADPATAPGNKALLAAFVAQSSGDRSARDTAPPLLFFRRVRVDGAVKGRVMFQGFGIVERAELTSQFDQKNGVSFSNYVYDFCVLSLAEEGEQFDWDWVSDRRDPEKNLQATLASAPSSWTEWVRRGSIAIPSVRRRVSKLLTTRTEDQRPPSGTKERRTLDEVYSFYKGREHRFELLAASIVRNILEGPGTGYTFGWLTPPSADGGADFVARLDLGSGFSKAKIVIYGQAKCEVPTGTTSGRDVARTVARLKRGWIGAYVTTGAFSEPVQREIIDDAYPLLLVPGARVATEVSIMARREGFATVAAFLKNLDSNYPDAVANRRPEEILLA